MKPQISQRLQPICEPCVFCHLLDLMGRERRLKRVDSYPIELHITARICGFHTRRPFTIRDNSMPENPPLSFALMSGGSVDPQIQIQLHRSYCELNSSQTPLLATPQS
jgi:hypothetical protein